jgi:hypothetical protein
LIEIQRWQGVFGAPAIAFFCVEKMQVKCRVSADGGDEIADVCTE